MNVCIGIMMSMTKASEVSLLWTTNFGVAVSLRFLLGDVHSGKLTNRLSVTSSLLDFGSRTTALGPTAHSQHPPTRSWGPHPLPAPP
jgi:hypothetical protein